MGITGAIMPQFANGNTALPDNPFYLNAKCSPLGLQGGGESPTVQVLCPKVFDKFTNFKHTITLCKTVKKYYIIGHVAC
jgi:hypothetical protein